MYLNRLVFTATAILFTSTLCAADKKPTTNPIIKHLKAIKDTRQPQGALNFVLQQPRIWHPGKNFKNGDNWLALACTQKECNLYPAKLEIQEEAWQGHYDDHPTNGQRLSFSFTDHQQAEVVAWFNTDAAPTWLRSGPVMSYQSPLSAYKRPAKGGNLEVRVNLPDDHADLVPMVLTQETIHRVWPEQRHYSFINLLQLRERGKGKGKRQLLLGRLGECHGFDSDSIKPEKYLRWAGDLNRDGLADYLISFIDEEGDVHLYLSDKADQEKLVGLAGIYSSPPWGGECTGG